MADIGNPLDWEGRTLLDRDGDRVGKIDAIYVDDRSGEPSWALVNTGLLGSRSTFVPIVGASASGDDLQVPFDKGRIKDAPNLDADEELTPDEERHLYDYYGVDYGANGGQAEADVEGRGGESAATGHGVGSAGEAGPVGEYSPGAAAAEEPTDEAGGSGHAAGAGQRRLRKYTIVTEEVVKEVIPVEDDDAPGDQPGPGR